MSDFIPAEQTVKADSSLQLKFEQLDLPKAVLKAIDKLGYEFASPIQALTLPYSLAGVDCIGRAQTGTGKTAAFLLTLITDFLENPLPKQFAAEPRSVILAPTRELALQIAADAKQLSQFCRLNVCSMVGGMDFDKQRQQIEKRNVDILVATPGRLLDFLKRGYVFLYQVVTLVIDEADRMLDMGFIPDIKYIVDIARESKIGKLCCILPLLQMIF